MKAFLLTFAHILLSIFLLSPLIFAQLQFSIRDGSIPIEQNTETRLTKRATHSYAYEWPSIDGNLHQMPAEKYFKTAYWTFNATFLHTLRNLANKNPKKAKEYLYKASIEYNTILQHECWKASNKSAKAHNRINTLARVASFPDDNPKHNIDPDYNLVAIVRVTCFERVKGGKNVNVPLVKHTKRLIKSLGWDKETALRKVKKMHKQFKPTKMVTKKAKNIKKAKNTKKAKS